MVKTQISGTGHEIPKFGGPPISEFRSPSPKFPVVRSKATASGKSLAPFVRVTSSMKHGVDDDGRLRMFVENGIREATY